MSGRPQQNCWAYPGHDAITLEPVGPTPKQHEQKDASSLVAGHWIDTHHVACGEHAVHTTQRIHCARMGGTVAAAANMTWETRGPKLGITIPLWLLGVFCM